MRAGPARTCMASKRVWIIWNKRLGKKRKQKWIIIIIIYIKLFHDIVSFRRSVYGPNLIDVPVKPCFNLLIEEVRFKRIWNLHVHFLVFEESLKMHFIPDLLLIFSGMAHSSNFLCFFRCSTHSTFSSWPASSCGVLIIIMFTPLAYSSSQSFPSVFRFMRSVRSVRLTCLLVPSEHGEDNRNPLWSVVL